MAKGKKAKKGNEAQQELTLPNSAANAGDMDDHDIPKVKLRKLKEKRIFTPEELERQQKRDLIRTAVRGTYAMQKLRIQMGNRIVGNFKVKLGQQPSETEEEMSPDAQKLLKELRNEFAKITDGVKNITTIKKFPSGGIISNLTELSLVEQYEELDTIEAKHFKRLGKIVEAYPIATQFLLPIRGIGPAMTAVILSEYDIYQAKYSSSLWAYAGLDVAEDGKGRSKRPEHLIDAEYEDKDGELKVKKSITFNKFLKTKLMGVLAPSFVRTGNNPYRDVYDNYKARLQARPDLAEHTKLHINNMALRYMIKMFLIDLYEAWRPLEGLECYAPYTEAKLGMAPHVRK